MKNTITIGIDGGNNIGIAIYNEGVMTLKKIEKITEFYTFIRATSILRISEKVIIYIEDVSKNKPNFKRIGKSIGEIDRRSQNVGMCKQRTKDIIEIIEFFNIVYELIKVDKNSLTKLSHVQFCKLTGCTLAKTNEHERDACMLIFGRIGEIKKWIK